MAATLYLNPDGVLQHQYNRRSARDPESLPDLSVVDATKLLEQLLTVFPRTDVVLHSYGVKLLGYQQAILHLSPLIQSRIIGSTYAGNRLVRFRCKPRWRRRDWLRDDLRRRMPRYPIVVDSDWTQLLPELSETTLIVSSSHGLAAPGMAKALFDLLLKAESASEPQSPVGWLSASGKPRCVFHAMADTIPR
ncbi:HAD domain-containing protein [Cupriavidus oxalaticus]|uniref:HAD domain-containing protein n=1 Tax=Cupriavidus oxalaticus TaxID=96344 RepID=UPI001248D12D|nr:HAD domain-containing protein [Cupriavidus oxalaticus]